VAVVPGDELRGRPRPREVLTGNPEPAIALRADRVDDGVVGVQELLVGDGLADLHVPEKAEARPRRDPLERARDLLQLRMVGRNAEADEAPGRRKALDHVHLDRLRGVQEMARGIEGRRPGADHGDANGCLRHRRESRANLELCVGEAQ
jgi:hypothetical protein